MIDRTDANAPSPRRRWRVSATALGALLVVVVAAGLAALSLRHASVMDWTAGQRHTLGAQSRALLARMPDPIVVDAFVGEDRTRREAVEQILMRYDRHAADLRLRFVDPDLEPRRAEEAGIDAFPALRLTYQDRSATVTRLGEAEISTALSRLAALDPRWVAYLQGDGQRDLLGESRTDLGRFGDLLEELGFRLRPLRLAEGGGIPEEIALLVVLEPTSDPAPGSLAVVEDYLDAGGHLLWLSDARHHGALAVLETRLGVRREPGMLVDPASKLFGRDTPEFILVSAFAEHPVGAELAATTAFPTATSLAWEATGGWRTRGIAASSLTSWLETGDLQQAVRFDDGRDTPGPLDLMVALERDRPEGRSQRALVVGDADFASNAYLGLVGNRALASAVVTWLTGDSGGIAVARRTGVDLDFAPTALQRGIIALAGPVVAPLAILLLGFGLWVRRRRR